MIDNNTKILLRFFVEADDASKVQPIVDAAAANVADFATVQRQDIKPYWKNAAYYEILLEMRPNLDSRVAFDTAMACLGTGWQRYDSDEGPGEEPGAVWNPMPTSSFFSPSVRWANIELLSVG